ncbi:unnamed protein product, partial [Meganyctiphanes norvegica]
MAYKILTNKVKQGQDFVSYVYKVVHFKGNFRNADIAQEVEKKFSVCGPVYNARVYKSRRLDVTEDGSDVYFGFVTYYSENARKRALKLSAYIKIGHEPVKITTKSSNKSELQLKLPLHKAQNLLTFYLGFNCWSSKVLYIEKEPEEDGESMIRFVCLVRVDLPQESVYSEGVGIGEAPYNSDTPNSKASAFMLARRFSFYSSMTAAFGKFIIIRLGNGKTQIEVDTTQNDPLVYDPAWDNPEVKVKDLTFSPDEEDESGLDGLSESQLDNLLDVSINGS